MIANYHTHSYHCHHASGKPEEYVEKALENGLKVLGFSDHVPYPFSDGHKSGFRMDVEETETYVNEILELREKYKNRLPIYIGYEAEYYPREFEAMLKNICQYPVDYLICGQHFTRNESDGWYSGTKTDDPAMLRIYNDQLIGAMQTGRFTYIAHPDLANFTGPDEIYREETLRLCEASKKYNVPLEYNVLGMSTHRHYPSDRFWKTVAETDTRVIIGSDAHAPVNVGNPAEYAQARANLALFGITPIDQTELKPVK